MIQRIRKKMADIQGDAHMQEVARGAVLALFLKIIGSGLAFAFNVAVARLIGVEGTGIYFLALSIVAIASVVARLGLDNALLRFVASHAAHGQWGHVQGVYVLGMKVAIASSLAVNMIVFAISPWIVGTLDKPSLLEPLRWMSLSILPFALLNLHAESLKGLKCIREALLVQGIGLPLLSLALIFPLVAFAGLAGAAMAYFLATSLVMLLAVWFWKKSGERGGHPVEAVAFQSLWAACKPLWVTALMNRGLMPWAPILLAGFWLDGSEVGLFSAATRVSLLVSFLLVTVNNVVAPKFAELYAKQDIQGLGATARRSAAMISALVMPLFALLLIWRDEVMEMFGQEFALAGDVLAILLIGQLVNVLSGSVGYLLMMSGHEQSYRNLTFVFAMLQMGMIGVLTPWFGLQGLAAAVALSLAGVNIAAAVIVYRKMGVVSVPLVGRFI